MEHYLHCVRCAIPHEAILHVHRYLSIGNFFPKLLYFSSVGKIAPAALFQHRQLCLQVFKSSRYRLCFIGFKSILDPMDKFVYDPLPGYIESTIESPAPTRQMRGRKFAWLETMARVVFPLQPCGKP
jgi:hypothetical protein